MHQHQRIRQQLEVSDNRRVSFYAAIFDEEAVITERDQGGKLVTFRERIAPGAFAASLASGHEVIANIDHDEGRTFARTSDGTLLVQEDPRGLFCSCWIPEGAFGDEIIADVKAGKLTATSFRFETVKDRTVNGVVEVQAVRLADVCLTSLPAYSVTKGEVHLRHHQGDKTKMLLTRLRLTKIKLAH